ncbi:MAG TPA: adenylate/guanylate cyclase domain-containing protein, partial [Actinomycetes bacterium]|nr:adenylate/guanylate cyclase domain-containing protein [Actinomycetes bacterium]
MDDLDPAELEEMLLEGPRLYRRAQVARYADSDLGQLTKLWRALGFPDVPEGSAAFTDADLVALRRVLRLARAGVFDEDFIIGVTRAMGYHLARLVEWEYVALAEHVATRDGAGSEDAGPGGLALLTEHLVDFEALLLYVWRRQLVATAGRVLGGADEEVARRRRTVGFADLVSYTQLSQRLEARELAALVDRFEALSADIIAEHGGRLVKTVGDEVL